MNFGMCVFWVTNTFDDVCTVLAKNFNGLGSRNTEEGSKEVTSTINSILMYFRCTVRTYFLSNWECNVVG